MRSLAVAGAKNSLSYPGLILCYYMNTTNGIQIVRSTNIETWYFERTIFPGERLLFEAPPTAQLEIHTNAIVTAIASDTICCKCLQIIDE